MKKILVRTPQWLGDAVVSTVFLTRLKTRFPDASISVLCVPALVPLFEAHPTVARVLTLPYPNGNVFTVGKMLRAEKFDEAYILPRSFRAALEAFLGRVPRRVGYKGDLRRSLLTEAFDYDSRLLYAHRYLKLIGEEYFPLINIAPTFPSSSRSKFDTSNLKRPVIGVGPASIAPSRTWSADGFAEVAQRLQKSTGGTVVLFGSSSEREAAKKVAEKIEGPVINTVGELSLPELGGMVKQCQIMLANDSGLMHVAAAFQVPSVILFGASDPATALPPWGKFVPIQHKEISCVPCLRNHCVRLGAGHLECLKSITAAEVVEAAHPLLK